MLFSYLEGFLLISGVSGFSGFLSLSIFKNLETTERDEDFSYYYKTFLIILSFYERDLKVLLQVISANRELNLETVLLNYDVK